MLSLESLLYCYSLVFVFHRTNSVFFADYAMLLCDQQKKFSEKSIKWTIRTPTIYLLSMHFTHTLASFHPAHLSLRTRTFSYTVLECVVHICFSTLYFGWYVRTQEKSRRKVRKENMFQIQFSFGVDYATFAFHITMYSWYHIITILSNYKARKRRSGRIRLYLSLCVCMVIGGNERSKRQDLVIWQVQQMDVRITSFARDCMNKWMTLE